MRTAKAKGLSQVVSIFKHALRNAILPVITYVGPMLAYTLSGSFVVEKIFTIPGLGGEFIGSITSRDYTVIMGTTIFVSPSVGKILNLTPKKYISTVQITKLGTAIPQVATTLIKLSMNFPLRIAAIHPSGIPIHRATNNLPK